MEILLTLMKLVAILKPVFESRAKFLLQFELQQCRENEHNLTLTRKTLIKNLQSDIIVRRFKGFHSVSFESFQRIHSSRIAQGSLEDLRVDFFFHLSSFC